MDLQELVNAHQSRLSDTEREILAFMLNNEQFVADSTISALAHKTFSSTSSIIRLTKKLGFSGFAELKFFVKNSLIESSDRPTNFLESGRNDILKTYEGLMNIDFDPIVRKIENARTIYCYGTGFAQRTAIQEFSKSMLACGKFTHVIPASSEFRGSIGVMKPEDLVIIASLSGETASALPTVRALAARKVPMIAITALGVNTISAAAEFSLHYESTPTVTLSTKEPYHSFVALTVLLDYTVRQYIQYIDSKEKKP
ncbi:MurR/RpiR family transcriptional regulator [Rothia nasisuis]|uniref:RpiR family transcriptional regulator n=1 Tax=Rothia nasimurium TaxID=85336 RepID=A0A1Y1RSB1_9MICC|nr:MurR/RpiR family transcriptional regulator [Rothia nasisuis]ORC24498.1 RpiR family transcriptional regulator [Rothia nasimurium]